MVRDPDRHLHGEEPPPEFTTPQGTQSYGVEHGHEETDVNPRTIIDWLAGLAVCVVVISLALYGSFMAWRSYERGMVKPPSPVFAVREEPPSPRILPNPFDTPNVLTRDHPAPPGVPAPPSGEETPAVG